MNTAVDTSFPLSIFPPTHPWFVFDSLSPPFTLDFQRPLFCGRALPERRGWDAEAFLLPLTLLDEQSMLQQIALVTNSAFVVVNSVSGLAQL